MHIKKLITCLLIICFINISLKGDNMPLLRWKPFHDFDEFFEMGKQGTDLAVDVSENENQIILKMNIPGIDPDKVDIEVEDHHVYISGSREEESETEDQHYYRKEIRRGAFERVIELPTAVDKEKTSASYENGVLTIVFQKKGKQISGKKINITRK